MRQSAFSSITIITDWCYKAELRPPIFDDEIVRRWGEDIIAYIYDDASHM